MRTQNRIRDGFTLPELMVAAAVSMALMAIIAVAFQRGIDAFRTLRAVGKLQDQLRAVENVIKRDLAAEHFDGPFQQGFSGPYVRDQRLDLVGWQPPAQGYFEIREGAAATSNTEGSDSDNIPIFLADGTTTNGNHRMRFTSKLTGKRTEDWYYAAITTTNTPTNPPSDPISLGGDPNFSVINTVPTNSVLASRWAEICYFLQAPASNPTTSGGVKLYTLYRQERVLLPAANTAPNPFQTPTTIQKFSNRNGHATFTPGAFGAPTYVIPTHEVTPSQGDDILVTNVISFDIAANWTYSPAINHVSSTNSPQLGFISSNWDWPFSGLKNVTAGGWGLRFDTGSNADVTANIDWNDDSLTDPNGFLRATNKGPLFRVRVNSLQIRLRIWDAPTQTTRQITIIQDI